MAIQIVPNKVPKRKIKPHYVLTFFYMIGDADGDTEEEMEVKLNNPYIERFVKILQKLTRAKDFTGFVLEEDGLVQMVDEGRITQEELEYLVPLMFETDDNSRPEFGNVVQSYLPGSYLVFEGVNLQYIDENGVAFQTKIVKDKK